MAIYRMQCSWMMDSNQPRDRMVITPHFESTGVIGAIDEDALAEDLATALATWAGPIGELQVKVYDAQGTPPVFPVGQATRNPLTVGTSGMPREVACCLSFYADSNQPRRRGRLYIPGPVITNGAAPTRPSTANMTKVGGLATHFAALGGTNIDWVVFSRADNDARRVTNWWVDDEWDTIRSRGLRGTARQSGTTTG